MTKLIGVLVVVLSAAGGHPPRQIDYGGLWAEAVPFHVFLEGVRARQEAWRTRFANAAVEAEAITRARALPGRRRILAVAEDRCSDSAWALPYIAKLAAAVPEKLELRVLAPVRGHRIQSANLTPDGRLATPIVAVLDDAESLFGVWVERPAELQQWYVDNKAAMGSDERHAYLSKWYTEDAGRTTIRELLDILERGPVENNLEGE